MSGSIELQSRRFQNACAGRPEFQVRMKRGATRDDQVVGLKNGLLLLDLAYADIGHSAGSTHDGTLGTIGAVFGGRVGRMIGDALESAGASPLGEATNNFAGYSDGDLVEMARKQKGTLIAPYDDIQSVVIDKPTMWETWTRGGAVAALISVREKVLKRMTWEIRDLQSLITACQFLPAKLGERVNMKMEFDPESLV